MLPVVETMMTASTTMTRAVIRVREPVEMMMKALEIWMKAA